MGCAVPPTGSSLAGLAASIGEDRQPIIGTPIWIESDLNWQPPRALACLLRPIGFWVAADDPRLTREAGDA